MYDYAMTVISRLLSVYEMKFLYTSAGRQVMADKAGRL